MYEVRVTERFRAAHAVELPDGQLEPLHEHDWRVTIMLGGAELDERGLLVDFVAIRERLRGVVKGLRGRNLNQLAPFARRTASAEHVAGHFADELRGLGPRGPGRDETSAHAGVPDAAHSGGARLCWVEIEEEVGCVVRYHVTPDEGGR